MKKVEGGFRMDGITTAQRRRMQSALNRLEADIKSLELSAVSQDGMLNGSQEARYQRMTKEADTLRDRI